MQIGSLKKIKGAPNQDSGYQRNMILLKSE